MVGPRRGVLPRMVWAVIVGMFLGALLTKIAVIFMPDSAARDFLTTSVSASLGPLSIDLIAVCYVADGSQGSVALFQADPGDPKGVVLMAHATRRNALGGMARHCQRSACRILPKQT